VIVITRPCDASHCQGFESTHSIVLMKRRQWAWILILSVDVAYIAWGTGAAAWPHHLLGPGGKGILPAGYEGYSGGSWSQLAGGAPLTAGYMTILFRMYGIYCVLFGIMGCAITVTAFRRGERWAWWTLLVANVIALVSAISYDKMVNAIGPFEITEYLGLAMILCAFVLTAPFLQRRGPEAFPK
jgi:hypothetical protein